jgi:hypothetical protein
MALGVRCSVASPPSGVSQQIKYRVPGSWQIQIYTMGFCKLGQRGGRTTGSFSSKTQQPWNDLYKNVKYKYLFAKYNHSAFGPELGVYSTAITSGRYFVYELEGADRIYIHITAQIDGSPVIKDNNNRYHHLAKIKSYKIVQISLSRIKST